MMCQAQYSAGLAFNSAQLGNAHSLAHALGAIYSMPHGNANAIMLPYVMLKNKPAVPELMAEIAEAMGVDTAGLSVDDAAEKAVGAVKILMDSIGVPKTVTALADACKIKISKDDIPELVAHASNDLACGANPILYTLDDFTEIYEKAWV